LGGGCILLVPEFRVAPGYSEPETRLPVSY